MFARSTVIALAVAAFYAGLTTADEKFAAQDAAAEASYSAHRSAHQEAVR